MYTLVISRGRLSRQDEGNFAAPQGLQSPAEPTRRDIVHECRAGFRGLGVRDPVITAQYNGPSVLNFVWSKTLDATRPWPGARRTTSYSNPQLGEGVSDFIVLRLSINHACSMGATSDHVSRVLYEQRNAQSRSLGG